MMNRAIHIGATHYDMNIKVGNLYQITDGYYSDLPDEDIVHGGAWAVNVSTLERIFMYEGTPAMVINYCGHYDPRVLIEDKIYMINPAYLKDL